MAHDPANVALGRLAIERGIVDRARALAALEQAAREGVGLLDVLRRDGADPRLEALARELGGRRGPKQLGPGDKIAGLTIEKVLGQGAMGAVYAARNDAGARRAVKVPLFGGDPEEVHEQRARFEREAQALARLKPHRNVVQVHAAGFAGELPYCVLELVEGPGLDKVLAAGAVPLEQVLDLGEQLASGLAHAHAAGIVHRDLKPANVLVRAEDGSPVITDFGLVRDAASKERLTQEGTILGTPLYMPPEQAGVSAPADARSDIYALGAVLYHAATGRPPILAGSMEGLLMKIHLEAPPVPSQLVASLPRDLDLVLLHALEKEPHARYATAAELAQDLARVRAGEPVSVRAATRAEAAKKVVKSNARSIALWGGGGAFLLLAAGGALVGWTIHARSQAQDLARQEATRKNQERLAAEEARLKEEAKTLDLAHAALSSAVERACEPAVLAGTKPASPGELAPAIERASALLGAGSGTTGEAETRRSSLRSAVERSRRKLAFLEALDAFARRRDDGAALAKPFLADADPELGLPAVLLALRWLLDDQGAKSPGLALALRASPALTALKASPAPDGASSEDLALALLPALETTAEAKLAAAEIHGRAIGRLSPEALREPRRAGPARDFLLSLVPETSLPLAKRALPALLAAACAPAGAGPAVHDLVRALSPDARQALAIGLARADAEDMDLLGRLPLTADIGSVFEELADAAPDVVKDKLGVAVRLYSHALRADVTVGERHYQWQTLKDAVTYADENHGDAWARVIDSFRIDQPVRWDKKERERTVFAELAQRLDARSKSAPRDWALELAVAYFAQLDVTAETERAVALATDVARDPRAPRACRGQARFIVGCHHLFHHRDADALEQFLTCRGETSFEDEITHHIARCQRRLWIAGGKKDEALGRDALETAKRALDETHRRLEQHRGGLAWSRPVNVVPVAPHTSEAELETSAATVLVETFVAESRFDEAEDVVKSTTAASKLWQARYRAVVTLARGGDAAVSLREVEEAAKETTAEGTDSQKVDKELGDVVEVLQAVGFPERASALAARLTPKR
jgi:hypothetical protein